MNYSPANSPHPRNHLPSAPLCLCGLLLLYVASPRQSRATDILPGKAQEVPILLTGGDVYTVSGDVIPKGQVLFDAGKIVAVGKTVDAPAGAKRIDVSGKRVYPGLVASGNDLGLVEVPSVRATRDTTEAGQINPNARAEVAVNPDSELIPVARANGILINLTTPSGGMLSGTSAVMQLDGWTWEDLTLKAPAAMHLEWPRMTTSRSRRRERTSTETEDPREQHLKGIDHAFDDARAYLTARKAGTGSAAHSVEYDARWEAMVPLLEGRIPLVVAAEEIRQIEAAVDFAAREKVKLIIFGGYDAPLCADLLKKHDVAVIIDGVQRLPTRPDDAYDAAYTLPERLRQAGIRFCITANGRASSVRNLPYHAATAAAYGLPADEALKSITLYPAQILNVADRIGSLEKGKDATLIVTNGDILETATHVERAYIKGREVDLSSRHTKLWEKYEEKYRRQGTGSGLK